MLCECNVCVLSRRVCNVCVFCADVFTQPVPRARDRRTDAARAQQRARARTAPHTGAPDTCTHTVTVHFTHLIQSVSAYVMTLNVPQYSLMGISGFD